LKVLELFQAGRRQAGHKMGWCGWMVPLGGSAGLFEVRGSGKVKSNPA